MPTMTRPAKRRQRTVDGRSTIENTEFTAFARRIIRAHGRRVGDGDPVDLAELVGLAKDLDTVIDYAVRTMRANHGYSWADIARELGITRQAAQQRFGDRVRPTGRNWIEEAIAAGQEVIDL